MQLRYSTMVYLQLADQTPVVLRAANT
ncbi:hypothetical protein D918_08934 [Trichuris suis]|nr:hypothetical protein D918_08934 [Trichuris suis]